MRLHKSAALLSLSSWSTALVARASKLEACPILGKQYPAPKSIASESKLQDAAKKLDSTLAGLIKQAPYKGTTFSIGVSRLANKKAHCVVHQMFSASDVDLFYEYHHTGPAVANSTFGVNKVDADSIYRIGSISKLLTVYLFLLCESDIRWNDPVSKFLPQLLQDKENSWNDITPEWDQITIGDLAGQMGGLARDYGLVDLQPLTNALAPIPDSVRAALPNVTRDEKPTCGWTLANMSVVECTTEEYLLGVANESPIFSTTYTPVYSNEGFALVGLLLQSIARTPIEQLFNENLVKSVGLESTYFEVSTAFSDRGVIPGSPDAAGWSTVFRTFSPAGGYLSTVNDFTKLGKAILSDSSLPKSVTNLWMKPTTFLENWSAGVGRPWEIFRLKVNGQSVDWYTKSGDWGVYHSFFGLLPNYDIGITLLTAETLTSSDVRDSLPFILKDAILPVLDEIARDQAEANFGGHYTSNDGNSSTTLTTDGTQSGLKVTQLISNGVDVFGFFSELTPNLVWRLQPNQLDYGNGKVGFTSYQTSAIPANTTESPILACGGWFDVDPYVYANIPLGQTVFSVDESGKADSVNLRGFRMTLDKKSSAYLS